MVVLIVAVVIASQYSPGVMADVVRVRQHAPTFAPLPLYLPSVDGFVAVRDCDRIGELILIRPVGVDWWETHMVADCTKQPGTDGAYEWMTENGIGVEVSYETAARWGYVGRGFRVEIGEMKGAGYVEKMDHFARCGCVGADPAGL